MKTVIDRASESWPWGFFWLFNELCSSIRSQDIDIFYEGGGYVGPFVNLALIEILILNFSDILGRSLLSHLLIFVLLSLLVLEL